MSCEKIANLFPGQSVLLDRFRYPPRFVTLHAVMLICLRPTLSISPLLLSNPFTNNALRPFGRSNVFIQGHHPTMKDSIHAI